jgi:outer membrane protein assembly factor BamD
LKFNQNVYFCTMLKKINYIFVVLFIVIAASCSNFNKILKSTNLEEKYKAAEAYYLKGDYYHAQQLFEELITYYRGTDKAEKIYYYYAYSYYGLEDFVTAAYYFKTFSTTYPNSKYARESQYLSAYCTYLDSPDYSLDQANTLAAIKELQLFVDMYPKSDSVTICNKLIDDARFKLELKEYQVSKLYYKLQEYKAAIVSYKNTLKDYPDTKYKEECLYYIMKSNYYYALNSIESKKVERFKAAMLAYQALIDVFPQSKYLKDAETMNKNALKEISKIKSTKS